MTAMTALTHDQMLHALSAVATWLGPQMREDGRPVPTGAYCARRGLGPMLHKRWALTPSCLVAPTILLEGGPEDWAYRVAVELRDEFHKMGVHAEAYACYALQLYPAN